MAKFTEIITSIDEQKAAFEKDGGIEYLIHAAGLENLPLTTIYSSTFEKDNRILIAEICYHFAKTGAWPQLRPGQQLLIYERLKAARELLWVMQNGNNAYSVGPVQIAENATASDTLSFLLVDYWVLLGKLRRFHHPIE